MNRSRPPRILVIKLSALGDFIQSIGAFQAIRAHHQGAHITLLTTGPFVELSQASGCFDEIWRDERPQPWQVEDWLRLARRLRTSGFTRVYDLQRSQRSGWYFWLLAPRPPEWVGSVAGCSHRYRDPEQPTPIGERHAALLALGGINGVPAPDLSFLEADLSRFEVPRPYALVVPGSSAHRPLKRWPTGNYAVLAQVLAAGGLAPVLIGGSAERDVVAEIARLCPRAHDLSDQTDLAELATLARGASVAIGNDTGPTHVIAAAGCPTVVLFSRDSDPVKSRPAGARVRVLQRPSLNELPVSEVLEAVAEIER